MGHFIIIHFKDFEWPNDHGRTIRILLLYILENMGFVFFFIGIIFILIPVISTFQSEA